MLAGPLALVVAALFAGAALYVSSVEQPARLSIDIRAAIAEWRPAYKGGTAMQAPLAAIGFLLGALAWWQTREPLFGVGALAMIANWPWTFLAIMPVNGKLMKDDAARTDSQTRALLEKWGRLHAVRTGFGLLATLVFLWALA